MEMDVEEFRRRFPALYREIKARKMTVSISGIREMSEYAEREASTNMPSVVDYLRRCDTDEEGKQVIDFLLKRGELTAEEAGRLLKQLENYGIRSFGSRKQLGYYFRKWP